MERSISTGNFYDCDKCGKEFFLSWKENSCQCSGCVSMWCSDCVENDKIEQERINLFPENIKARAEEKKRQNELSKEYNNRERERKAEEVNATKEKKRKARMKKKFAKEGIKLII